MELRDFKVGDTVRIHPASDWFMRGVTVATVIKVGRKWLTVADDVGPLRIERRPVVTVASRTFKLHPGNVLEVLE